MSEFWNMGGYGLYVWSSYAAAVIVFAWNIVAIRTARRDAQRRLGEDEAIDD